MSEDLFEDSQEYYNPTFLEYEELVDFLSKNHVFSTEGSLACFEMFCETTQEFIYNKNGTIDPAKLESVGCCINKLKSASTFDRNVFVTCLFDTYLTIPLPLVWWLQKNEVLTFAEYCKERMSSNIVEEFVSLHEENNTPQIFNNGVIVVDILDELICGAYAPRLGICRLPRSKIWNDYCKNALNHLAAETVRMALKETESAFFSYLKILSKRKHKFSQLYKYYFKTVLLHLFTTDVDELDLQAAYKYQYLFTLETLADGLSVVLETSFDFLQIEDMFGITEENTVNWKYVLYSVSVCINKRKCDVKRLEDTVRIFVNNTFKGGKMNELIKAFVFIRQGLSVASANKTYKTWYSETFGMNTVLKTGQNATIFKYFMQCLTHLIAREPKETLQVHLQSSVRAPVNCNSLIFDYKSLGRARLEELKQGVHVKFLGQKIPLLHLIDDCFEKNNVTRLMQTVIAHSDDDFKKMVLLHLQEEKFSGLRCLYMKMYSLTEDSLKNASAYIPCLELSDDDSDFALGK